MTTWAIGDIHGCFATLDKLWRRLPFDHRRDRLWLVGDLVNRGPRSLRVLRWARALQQELGDRMTVVLGNHDVHLIGRADGVAPAKRRDTLGEVLAAPDRDELVDWLSRRPLLHRDGDVVLVHAGLLPRWTADEASVLARRVEARLRDHHGRRLLLDRGSRKPVPADGELREVLRALVTLRTVTAGGEPCCDFSGPPDEAPEGCLPWFSVPGRRHGDLTFVCGHWAAMGLRLEPRLVALDSGVAWGGPLTAIRLEDRAVWQEERI